MHIVGCDRAAADTITPFSSPPQPKARSLAVSGLSKLNGPVITYV